MEDIKKDFTKSEFFNLEIDKLKGDISKHTIIH